MFGSNVLFQSTRPRGREQNGHGPKLSSKRFQSTRPRGRERWNGFASTLFNKFQSTRPRGREPTVDASGCTGLQFQSTRPRGRELLYANILIGSHLWVIFRGSPTKSIHAYGFLSGRDSNVFELAVFIGIADQPVISKPLNIRDSDYDWPLRIVSGFGSDVFNPFVPVCA